MTDFYKIVADGYIVGVGINGSDEAAVITEAEYSEILFTIRNKPTARDGYDYRLKTDLTWEEYKLSPVESEPLTDEEALTRYANELTGQNDQDLLSAAESMITKLSKEES